MKVPYRKIGSHPYTDPHQTGACIVPNEDDGNEPCGWDPSDHEVSQ